ncbi:hypothetical protein [Metabacillus fastidiosus]|uniref:hypothetical protein n=1 Tax=Metabacillus fastidiosus TaxID=1458 RepID=UPI003D2E44E6
MELVDDPDVISLKDFFQRTDSGGSGLRIDDGSYKGSKLVSLRTIISPEMERFGIE